MGNGDPITGRLVNGIIMILILYIIAVPFYVFVESFSLVESIYFVTTSITSVGYGDLSPKTEIGKMFTVMLLLSGVTIFFYHVTHLGQFKERTIDPHIQRRLEVLRHLTALQTGNVESSQLKKIKEKMASKEREKEREGRDDKGHGFGRL